MPKFIYSKHFCGAIRIYTTTTGGWIQCNMFECNLLIGADTLCFVHMAQKHVRTVPNIEKHVVEYYFLCPFRVCICVQICGCNEFYFASVRTE